MKWLILSSLLMLPVLAWPASYTVLSDAAEEDLLTYYATRESRTNQQVLRRMCNVGIASFRAEYQKATADGREGVFRQMTPEDRTTVCGILSSYGFTCPSQEP